MKLLPLLRPLVGLLLLGAAIYGVLRSGEGLRAPPLLASTWALSEGAGCVGDTLTFTQSGVYLHGTGDDTRLRGKLDGDAISLFVTCAGGRARLSGRWTPESIEAQVRQAGCGCAGGLRGVPAP